MSGNRLSREKERAGRRGSAGGPAVTGLPAGRISRARVSAACSCFPAPARADSLFSCLARALAEGRPALLLSSAGEHLSLCARLPRTDHCAAVDSFRGRALVSPGCGGFDARPFRTAGWSGYEARGLGGDFRRNGCIDGWKVKCLIK